MKKLVIFLICVVVFMACNKHNINGSVLVYSMKNNVPESYKVVSEDKGDYIQYVYQPEIDSLQKLDFKYLKSTGILVLGSDTLVRIKSSFKPRNTEFKMFQSHQNKKHTRTYVFNKEYGLFASLGFTSHQLFLQDSVTLLEKESIFKGLFIELNKIYLD